MECFGLERSPSSKEQEGASNSNHVSRDGSTSGKYHLARYGGFPQRPKLSSPLSRTPEQYYESKFIQELPHKTQIIRPLFVFFVSLLLERLDSTFLHVLHS